MRANCSVFSLLLFSAFIFCAACSTSGSEYLPDIDGDKESAPNDGDETMDGDIDEESNTELGINEEELESDTDTESDTSEPADDDNENYEHETSDGDEQSDGDEIQSDGDIENTDDPGLTGEIQPCQPVEASESLLLLKGTVITPEDAWLNGEVLTDSTSGEILCAAEDCSGHAQYQEASVICAEGVIMPAMLDPHNHSAYNTIPRWKHEGDGHCWQNGTHCQRLNGMYRNRYKWADDPDYDNTLKVHYNTLKSDHHCAMQKWAEIRMMMHGTSGVAGSYNTSICHCHLDGDLMMVRNLDQPRTCSGLDSDRMRSSISNPCDLAWESYYSGVCEAFSSGDANVIFLHVAEGVTPDAQDEFYCLLNPNENDAGKTFLIEQIIGIHSTAAYSNETRLLACTGMQDNVLNGYKIVWSPRSNIDLYGQTTNVPLALNLGITVAIGPDWTPSGSLSQLQEMRCARYISERYWNNTFDDRTLVRMTTDIAARVMKIEDRLGSLRTGSLADVTVISANENGRRHPYATILNAEAWDVRLLLIGGRPMYGDSGIAPYNSFCETLDVCGHDKTICVKMSDDAADAEKGFTQTLTDIRNELTAALQPLKDNATEEDKYIFELMPLVYCPGTPEYEADQAEEVCAFKHNPHEDVLFAATPQTPIANDQDEDGYDDDTDNCPQINNADQMDRDGNGIGDACEGFEITPPPSADCACTVNSCDNTECYGAPKPYLENRWKNKACYAEDGSWQQNARLAEISDLWHPNSKFGAKDGDILQISGALITAIQKDGYYICDRNGHANAAIFVKGDTGDKVAKTGNEVDLIGEFENDGRNIALKALHIEPADSHRIEAEV